MDIFFRWSKKIISCYLVWKNGWIINSINKSGHFGILYLLSLSHDRHINKWLIEPVECLCFCTCMQSLNGKYAWIDNFFIVLDLSVFIYAACLCSYNGYNVISIIEFSCFYFFYFSPSVMVCRIFLIQFIILCARLRL